MPQPQCGLSRPVASRKPGHPQAVDTTVSVLNVKEIRCGMLLYNRAESTLFRVPHRTGYSLLGRQRGSQGVI
jgi:hypothetical protein